MNTRDLSALLLLGALWGASYLFIRLAVPELGPVLLIDLRVIIAGAALVFYAAVAGTLPALRPKWKQFLVLGALNAAVPFTFIAFAEIHVAASIAAILIAATPLFTALVSTAWLGEELTTSRFMGLLMGAIGVATIVGLSPVSLDRTVVLSVAALILAAFSYSVAGVYAKRTFVGAPPMTLAIGQQLAAGAILLPVAVATSPTTFPSTTVLLAVVGLALLSTAVAYLLYFHLIGSVGPTRTLLVTFLAPAFGVAWGVAFLDETINPGMLVGFGIVLASIMLVADIRIDVFGKEKKV